VSDQWKAIAARRSAIKIISLTSLLLIFITTAIFPIVLVSWLIVGSFYGVPDFLLEADVIIVLTIFALPYVIRVLRVRVRG
jgi:membrane protein required for beta-lactamase induction